MMMKRRNFLKISAASALTWGIGHYQAQEWHWRGIAFGSDVEIVLRGDKDRAQAALHALRLRIDALENRFSLYRPTSEISLYNQGDNDNPSADMQRVLSLAQNVHAQSFGQFDIAIGKTWQERAGRARLAMPQITLNGIAQGYASDEISQLLRDYGFDKTLVNMGEYVANSGQWRLDIMGEIRGVSHAGIATSRADGMLFPDGGSHIISPTGRAPRWAEITVIAKNGALADAWSTAMILLDAQEIRHIVQNRFVRAVYVKGFDGAIAHIQA